MSAAIASKTLTRRFGLSGPWARWVRLTEPKAFRRLPIILLWLLATGAASQARGQTQVSNEVFRPTTLSISALGEVSVEPDMATVRLSATTVARTAAEALALNGARTERMLAALKSQRIAARDLQTTHLTLTAQNVFEQGQPPRLTGYETSNQIIVTIRDLRSLGSVIDAAVAAGANEVDSISFGLADLSPAEDAARRLAVQSLQAEADLYTRATGCRASRLISLSEGGASRSPIAPVTAFRATAKGARETPISTG